MIQYEILGPLTVRFRDVPATPRSPRQQVLLAMLLLACSRVVSADRLIEELWEQNKPRDPAAALRNQVSRLRNLLGPAADALTARGNGYLLVVDPPQLDAHRFEQALLRARQQDSRTRLITLDQALGLWRGHVLSDVADRPFAQPDATRLEELRCTAVEERAEIALALGEPSETVGALEALLAVHPHRELARGLLMQALYRQGRPTEALSTYRDWRRRLAEDLGLDPSPALQRLERDVLRHTVGTNTEFTPPRSSGTPPVRHNVPSALTPFVGRRNETDQLRAFLTDRRLVTLTGVGGVGKTRLALEAARASLSAFPDGVFFIDLAPLQDPALIAQQVVTAIGTAGSSGADPLEEAACYLQHRRTLLLLDNCEHLLGAVASLSESLLARCEHLVVLATSREPLGLAGESAWRIPPLRLPPDNAVALEQLLASDAGALLCQRAELADPTFRLADTDATALAQICRRLDGLPLAIELAAARLHMLSPDELAARLDDRFRLLGGGRTTALPHQQTLRATMDWSYRLLTAREQELLRTLAVFPGPFSIPAAEAVAGERPVGEALEDLGRLVDKSLVVVERSIGETRLRLLETVREFCRDQDTDPTEQEVTRRRHRDFFLDSAAARCADLSFWWDTRGWLSRVRQDHDNFRVALEWSRGEGEAGACLHLAVGLSYYWALEGRFDQIEHLEWALAAAGQCEPIRVRGLACSAHFMSIRGDLPHATERLEEAIARARDVDDVLGAAFAQELLGVLEYGRGKLPQARMLLNEANRGFELMDCVAGRWGSCYDLGWLAVAAGDHAEATEHFDRALRLGRRSDSADLMAHSLAALAPLQALAGDSAAATDSADQAIELTRGLELPLFVVMALTRAAEAAVALQQVERARTLLAESLALLHAVGSQAWLADTLELVAPVLRAQGRSADAVRSLGAAQALIDGAGGTAGIRAVRGLVNRCREDLAADLDPATFAAEWARGRTISVQEAMTLAAP